MLISHMVWLNSSEYDAVDSPGIYGPPAPAAHRKLKIMSWGPVEILSHQSVHEHKLHKSWSGKTFLYYDLEIIMENYVESNAKFPAHYL